MDQNLHLIISKYEILEGMQLLIPEANFSYKF